ncbi:unnamed protein product, partial [marine sediment metagenome]
RFIDRQVVAASTGFIDGMGYGGAILVGIIVPFLVTSASGSWINVFIFWAILSVVTAILVTVVYGRSFRNKTIDFVAIKKED